MQPKKIAASAAFQFLSALQSFESSILLFSCCQLVKALQPTFCFEKTKFQEYGFESLLQKAFSHTPECRFACIKNIQKLTNLTSYN